MISIYKEFSKVNDNVNLLHVLNEIKNGTYKEEVNAIRYATHKEDLKLASTLKKQLLGFTTSGTFGSSRTKEDLVSYSNFICLDVDKLTYQELDGANKLINECEYTFASFKSPSGNGIKVIVKVNTDSSKHEQVYSKVVEYYAKSTKVECDTSCKDITRLCFVSYDEDLYLNENSKVFELIEEITNPLKQTVKEEKRHFSIYEAMDKCLQFTEKVTSYHEGNRNNFIYTLARNANRMGIEEMELLDYCITNFDLEEKEIRNAVKSAYKHNNHEFGKFANFAKLPNEEVEVLKSIVSNLEEYEDCLKNTPFIPEFVYQNLPPILLESCNVFTQPRERDVFLTGALAILSGCLQNVSGIYGGSVVYPSLFSFVLAPAASGKGALKFAKALADKYHDKTLATSIDEKKRYEENLASYKMLKAKGKLEENQEMPQAPKFKVVFIPANTSNAKIMQHLDCNEGRGIICETEADTLGQTFKNEWGAYSDLLRKSFHHERISKSIKSEGEYIEVNSPQLAVALSGTPKQVFNIISSAEDGLFSRFVFYVFKTENIWIDPSPKGNPINYTDFFTIQSKQVLKLVEYFERDELVMHLTEEQWDKLNVNFDLFLSQVNTFVSEDAVSVVKRLGLILFRICMIFTAIRKYKTNEYTKELYCDDTDFDIALLLVSTYIQHSVIMFTNLPKQGEQGPFKSGDKKKLFFDALPQKFQRKEAVEIGKKFNLGERTIGSFLKSCVGKFLNQPEFGVYEKINKFE